MDDDNNEDNTIIHFDLLTIKIPDIVKSYSFEKQKLIFEYLNTMDDHSKTAYNVAYEHLGSSFNIYRSNGFKNWLKNIK